MKHAFCYFGRPEQPDEPRSVAWRIEGDELHHLRNVVREKLGAVVEVTNGRGEWVRGRLERVDRQVAEVSPDDYRREERDRNGLTLVVGSLKHGVLDKLLPSLVELGVDRIHVFGQQGQDSSRLHPRAQERWERIVQGSVKQCKRLWLPELGVSKDLRQACLDLELGQKDASGRLIRSSECPYVLGEYASHAGERALLDAVGQPGRALIVIGAEQGLSETEVSMMQGIGMRGLRLGRHVLRAVTCATAVASVFESSRTLG